MRVSIVLFELHRPGEARAESQHGGEDDGGSMFLEPQAFLQSLTVLYHVQLPLLGCTGYPRHHLPVNNHLLLRAHEHLPELLQPSLHFSDDTLALLHLQEAPSSCLKLHAGARGYKLGGGGRGRGGWRFRASSQSPCHPLEVSHGNGAPGGWRGQHQEGRGRCRRWHG